MTVEELQAIVDQFGGFDGAVVLSASCQYDEPPNRERRALIRISAFSQLQEENGHGWKTVSITAEGGAVFGWIECPKNSNGVLNWPVRILTHGPLVIIDFDPLHPVDSPLGIGLSAFFIGGQKVDVAVAEDLPIQRRY